MGWLELIPLIRRLLPMLSHLTPLLESMVAGRLTTRAESEKTVATIGEVHSSQADLLKTLQRQEEQWTSLAGDVSALRADLSTVLDRTVAQERQLADLAASLRTGVIALGVLVLLCAVLLAVLVARHS